MKNPNTLTASDSTRLIPFLNGFYGSESQNGGWGVSP